MDARHRVRLNHEQVMKIVQEYVDNHPEICLGVGPILCTSDDCYDRYNKVMRLCQCGVNISRAKSQQEKDVELEEVNKQFPEFLKRALGRG